MEAVARFVRGTASAKEAQGEEALKGWGEGLERVGEGNIAKHGCKHDKYKVDAGEREKR